jgi:hypothetical protein
VEELHAVRNTILGWIVEFRSGIVREVAHCVPFLFDPSRIELGSRAQQGMVVKLGGRQAQARPAAHLSSPPDVADRCPVMTFELVDDFVGLCAAFTALTRWAKVTVG